MGGVTQCGSSSSNNGLIAEEVRHVSQNADSASPFCIDYDTKKGTLSQQFVTHVAPPRAMPKSKGVWLHQTSGGVGVSPDQPDMGIK